MSDRERNRKDDDDLFPVGSPSGVGGEVLVPRDPLLDEAQRHPADAAMSDEEDFESPEGDDELLNPGSPEFEHLEKPSRSQ